MYYKNTYVFIHLNNFILVQSSFDLFIVFKKKKFAYIHFNSKIFFKLKKILFYYYFTLPHNKNKNFYQLNFVIFIGCS